jgi:hypothetical protein
MFKSSSLEHSEIRIAAAALLIAAIVPAAAGPSCESIRSRLTSDGRIEILETTESSIWAAGRGFSGGVTILCGSNQTSTDLVIGINSQPDKEFMSYFGDLAHRVTGVNGKAAQDAALRCYQSGKGYEDKGPEHGLFEGDRIDTKTLHIDCRVSDDFTSFGVFKPASPR